MSTDTPDDAAPPRRRRTGPWRVLGMVGVVVVGLVVVALLVDGLLLWSRPRRIDAALPGSPPGGTTVLLVGTDSRADDTGKDDVRRYGSVADNPGERADVVLALRRTDAGAVRLLEVPRDLLVVGAKGAPVRLTTTLLDGASGLTRSLCRSLGLGVDHVVEVRFPGVRSVVNTVGGVEVTIDRPLRDTYTKFHLGAGTHRLSGDDVLAYVAARNVEVQRADGTWVPDEDSVGNRSSKGADILRSLGRRVRPSPARPAEAQRLAWAAAGAVAVDSRLSPTDAPSLVRSLRALPSVATTRLPATTTKGIIPVARLEPSAGATLAAFEGSDRPAAACRPRLAEAQRP